MNGFKRYLRKNKTKKSMLVENLWIFFLDFIKMKGDSERYIRESVSKI